MRKDENKIKKIARLSFRFPLIRRSPEDITSQVLTKQSLHNYFAEKMSTFSVIVGYIFERLQGAVPQSVLPIKSLDSLRARLEKMQARFLKRYHNLTGKINNQLHVPIDLLKPIFDLIKRFEKRLISEVLNAGIRREELQEFNEKNLLFLSIKQPSTARRG